MIKKNEVNKADKYKAALMASPEDVTEALWEEPEFANDVELIHGENGELTVRFETDGSVYEYETGEVYSRSEWESWEAFNAFLERSGLQEV
jgi:hypothetical protein